MLKDYYSWIEPSRPCVAFVTSYSAARIEVNTADLERMIDPAFRKEIVEKFRDIGFQHIALDLEGYITGSLNRALGG